MGGGSHGTDSADRMLLPKLGNRDLGRIGPADAQLEAAQAELHGVPQRRAADKGNPGSLEQAHFPETRRQMDIRRQTRDDRALAWLEIGKKGHLTRGD